MSKKFASIVGSDGMNYRTIAEKLTAKGQKMNHATARNICMSALERVIIEISKRFDMNLGQDDIMAIARDPVFQDAFGDILTELMAQRQQTVAAE